MELTDALNIMLAVMPTIKLRHQKGGPENIPYRHGFAHIVLGDHGIDADGYHQLSPECVTYGEVEENVKQLKRELDKVLANARRKFPG